MAQFEERASADEDQMRTRSPELQAHRIQTILHVGD